MKEEKLSLKRWRRLKKRPDTANRSVGMDKKHDRQSYQIELDLDYYRQRYPDLAELNDNELERHWYEYGYQEGRFASSAHAEATSHFTSQTPESLQLAERRNSPIPRAAENRVELEFYLALNPDVRESGIATQSQAQAHFDQFGKHEGRLPSLIAWAHQRDLPVDALPPDFSLATVQQRCFEEGLEIEVQAVLDTLLGEHILPIPLAATSAGTASAYLELGKHYLVNDQKQRGRELLQTSLTFSSLAQSLECLGSSYLEETKYGTALAYYNEALESPNTPKWVYVNTARTLSGVGDQYNALAQLVVGIQANPDFTVQHQELDAIVETIWGDIQDKLLAYVDTGTRRQLIDQARRFATMAYCAYLPVFGGPAPDEAQISGLEHDNGDLEVPALPPLGHINHNRVLIVGDFHVPQCKRYRIDQKIEQLKAVGKEARAINWTDLADYSGTLAFYDVVIFYRVPAVPKVIKAIAQVNATGKLSLYEIDDLIFDADYPPSIASYGGSVSQAFYRDLTRGMALNNAAARLCRQGITSTRALCERLEPLVQEKCCWVHRNGLDHLNEFRHPDKSQKQTIDIFYGSGTNAHNSDFVDLALPAVQKLLEEIPEARLVVVGYLKLPNSFCTRFANQYTQLPPIKTVQGYWSLLEQADINIAVLHDDVINAGKSELKWFEAACYGVPSVVSSTANYRDVIRDGEDAFIAATTAEWYNALSQLATSQKLRGQIGQAALRRAQTEYSVKTLGGELVAQLEEAAKSAAERKRKVALVNVFFPPQSLGGATRVLADNVSALRKHYADEFDLCVFTTDDEGHPPHAMNVYNYCGIRVYRANALWREHMDWHPTDPEMYRLFNEFLSDEKPDIIHFHSIQRLTSSVVEAARDTDIPYLVTAHDAWWISDFQFLVDHNGKVYPEGHPDSYQAIELPGNITITDSIDRRRTLKGILRGANKVLTVSEAFADIYRKNGIPHLEVTPNGVSDDLHWAPKDTTYTDKVVCGHIGGMAEHKGYYLLKHAVLAAQPANLAFVVVDHSKDETYDENGYWGDVPVRFIGKVKQHNIVSLYRMLDVVFAPSTWPESFGLVTREASACSCWVVASNLGGIGENIVEGRSGHHVAPDTSDLTRIINKIDRKPKIYKEEAQPGEAARARVQAECLLEEYKSICRNLS